MALANTSFETPGAFDGWADAWTPIVTATGGEVATFAGLPGEPVGAVEGFEGGYGNDDYATSITGGTPAKFDPTLFPQPTVETLALWVGTYQITISGGLAAEFFGLLVVESFELGYGNDDYATEIVGGTTNEDDLAQWVEPYLTSIVGGTAATFNTSSGPTTREDFEDAQADRPFTVDLSTSPARLYIPGHDLDPDQAVTAETTELRPAPLADGAFYFVIVLDADHVRLAATAGGAAIVITDVGKGKHRLKADPSIYWTGAEL